MAQDKPHKSRWRRLLKILGIVGAVLFALLLIVYLLRWPLFGGMIRRTAEEKIGQVIGAKVSIGEMSGSLLTSVQVENVVIEPRGEDSLFSERSTIGRAAVEYSPLQLASDPIKALQSVSVADADLHLAKGDPSEEPWDRQLRNGLQMLDQLPAPPAVEVENLSVAYGDLPPIQGLGLALEPEEDGFTATIDLPDGLLQQFVDLPGMGNRIRLEQRATVGLSLGLSDAEGVQQLGLALVPPDEDGTRNLKVETEGWLTGAGRITGTGALETPVVLHLNLDAQLPAGMLLAQKGVAGVQAGAAFVQADATLNLSTHQAKIEVNAKTPHHLTVDLGAFTNAADITIDARGSVTTSVTAAGSVDTFMEENGPLLDRVLAQWKFAPIEASVEGLAALGLSLDSLAARGALNDRRFRIDQVVVENGDDRIVVTQAQATPFDDPLRAQAEVEFDITAAEKYLAPFGNFIRHAGPIKGEATVAFDGDIANAILKLAEGRAVVTEGPELPGPIFWESLYADLAYKMAGAVVVRNLVVQGGPHGRDYRFSGMLVRKAGEDGGVQPWWQVVDFSFDSGADRVTAEGRLGPDRIELDFQLEADWPLAFAPMVAVDPEGYGVSGRAKASGSFTLVPGESWQVTGGVTTRGLEAFGLQCPTGNTRVTIGGPLGDDTNPVVVRGVFPDIDIRCSQLDAAVGGTFYLEVAERVTLELEPSRLQVFGHPLQILEADRVVAKTTGAGLALEPLRLRWRGVDIAATGTFGDMIAATAKVAPVSVPRLLQITSEALPGFSLPPQFGTAGTVAVTASYEGTGPSGRGKVLVEGRDLAARLVVMPPDPEDDASPAAPRKPTFYQLPLGDLRAEATVRYPTEQAGLVTSADVRLKGPWEELVLQGTLPLFNTQDEAPVALQGKMDIDTTKLVKHLPPEAAGAASLWPRLALSFSGGGTAADPHLNAALRMFSQRALVRADESAMEVRIRYRDNQLLIPPSTVFTNYTRTRVGANVPLRISLAPSPNVQLPTDEPLTAQLEFGIPRLRDFATMRLPGLASLNVDGKLSMRAWMTGTMEAPNVRLMSSLNNVRAELPEPLSSVSRASVAVDYNGKALQLSAGGMLGDAPFKLAGQLRGSESEMIDHIQRALARVGDGQGLPDLVSPDEGPLDLRLTMERTLLLDAPDLRARVNSELHVRGGPDGLLVQGDVAIPIALVYQELAGGGGEGEGQFVSQQTDPLAFGVDVPLAPDGGIAVQPFQGMEAPPNLQWIRFDVNIRNTGEMRVQNSTVAMLLDAEIHIGGNLNELSISGNVEGISGEARVFAGTFIRIERLLLAMPRQQGIEPIIRFRGRMDVGTMRVFIRVVGPLSGPTILLVSDPPHPREELLSMLAFGRSLGTTTGSEAASQGLTQVTRLATKYILSDRLPRAEPSSGFWDALALEAGEEEQIGSADPVPWQGQVGYVEQGTVLRAEYVINKYLSIRSKRDDLGGVTTELQLRYSWGAEGEQGGDMQVLGEAPGGWEQPTPALPGPPVPTPPARPREYKVYFRGINRLSDDQVRKAIQPTIDRLDDHPWTAPYINDAEFRIRRLYFDRGHVLVSIVGTVDAGSAYFFINEGPQLLLGDVQFEGNESLDDQTLRGNLTTPSIGVGSPRFSFRLVSAQRQSIVGTYTAHGYLNADVVDVRTQIDRQRGQMNVTYVIDEGQQYRLAAANWHHVPDDDMAMLRALVENTRQTDGPGTVEEPDSWLGKPMPSSLPNQLAAAARDLYRNMGRPTTRVQVRQILDDANAHVHLDLFVNLGKLFRGRQVEISGLEKTSSELVRRLADLRTDDLVKVEDMREAERRLIRTGVFRSVQVIADPELQEDPQAPVGDLSQAWQDPSAELESLFMAAPDTQIEDDHYWQTSWADYQVLVDEMDPYEVRVRGGYGTYDGPLGGVDVTMRNLAGEADTLRLSTTITGRGRKAEADYTIPYAYTNSTALALGAFYEEMERPSFTSSTYGVTPRLIWRATDRQTYRLGFRLQQVETTDVEPGVDSGEVLNFQFLAPFISATYDRRNSTRLPRRGFIIGVHAEWTGEDVGSDISYTRIDGNVTGYVPLGDRVTLASSFKGGRIIPMEDTETIPISLRYFAGGATTVRGFEEQVLGPTVNGEPTGGEVYTALQTEMRYRIVGNFYGALFGDVGNVYTTWADVDITDQRYGVGGGIRIFTPAGALVLDLGVNPEPEPEESSSVLYFSFGMPF